MGETEVAGEMVGDGKVGIFGANGFIGRHLVARFHARGVPLVAISRHISNELRNAYPQGVEFIEADLRDPLAMASSLHGVSVVVQMISTSSPGLGNRHVIADIQENVIPHVAFLQSAVEAEVSRYIFISSGGTVYGPTSNVPIPEDAPTKPISSHGLTKLIIEKYLQMHGEVDDLDYVILRLSNCFGPGQSFKKGQGLVPAILQRHRQGLPVKIIGQGAGLRDYVFIDDVIDALVAAVEKEEARQSVINIGSGQGRSVMDVIETVEDVLGEKVRRENIGQRATDVDVNVLDVGLARRLLGWEPRTAFREGVERMLNWQEGETGVRSLSGDGQLS